MDDAPTAFPAHYPSTVSQHIIRAHPLDPVRQAINLGILELNAGRDKEAEGEAHVHGPHQTADRSHLGRSTQVDVDVVEDDAGGEVAGGEQVEGASIKAGLVTRGHGCGEQAQRLVAIVGGGLDPGDEELALAGGKGEARVSKRLYS